MENDPLPGMVNSFETLINYLDICDPLALCHSVHGKDFHSPVAGSQARDETAYTTGERDAFETVIFGRIQGPVKWKEWHRTFRITCDDSAPQDVRAAFDDQLYRLASLVKTDDENDIAKGPGYPQAYPATDSDRLSAKRGTYLEVHVDQLNFRRCKLYELVDGALVTRVPEVDAEWPLMAGDWVLFRATMHRYTSIGPPFVREYYVLATALRVASLNHPTSAALDLSPDAVNTDDKCDVSLTVAVDHRSISLSASTFARPSTRPTTPERSEAKYDVANIFEDYTTYHMAAGTDGDEISPARTTCSARAKALKRKADEMIVAPSSVDTTALTDDEHNSEVHTPRKKRQTARMSTGGRPPEIKQPSIEVTTMIPSFDIAKLDETASRLDAHRPVKQLAMYRHGQLISPQPFQNYCTAMLFPTGDLHSHWVDVPLRLGVSTLNSPHDLDVTWYINPGSLQNTSSIDRDLTSMTVTHWPFDEPTPLSHPYTVFVAPQLHVGQQENTDTHPVNRLINTMVPGLAMQWRGNVLVFRSSNRNIEAGVDDMAQRDTYVAKGIVQRIIRECLIGRPVAPYFNA
ncbi:hypothetical protein DFH09DRAFT_1338809 [Mycena vulgaris]|nr:hypothetical protein DFH09DRAFT_1338809 [Mycena vulgaris]